MSDPIETTQWGASLFFVALLSIGLTLLAKKRNFFRLPPIVVSSWPTFKQVVGAFFVYIAISFIVIPSAIILYAWIMPNGIASLKQLSLETRGWLQFGALFAIFAMLIVYCAWIKRESLWAILGQNWSWKRAPKNCAMGVFALVVSYPWVVLISLLVALLASWAWGAPRVEQTVVKQLIEFKQYPLLFTAMALLVVFFIPIIEEVLFRGFLQSWLRRKIGRFGALFLTAALFAIVHFVPSQGIGNVELIVSLFVLACALGFIYEKEQSLLAPISLHVAFNGVSVLILSFST